MNGGDIASRRLSGDFLERQRPLLWSFSSICAAGISVSLIAASILCFFEARGVYWLDPPLDSSPFGGRFSAAISAVFSSVDLALHSIASLTLLLSLFLGFSFCIILLIWFLIFIVDCSDLPSLSILPLYRFYQLQRVSSPTSLSPMTSSPSASALVGNDSPPDSLFVFETNEIVPNWFLLLALSLGPRPSPGTLLGAMTTAWKPQAALTVSSILDARFLFKFASKADWAKVVSNGPWHIDHDLLIVKSVSLGEQYSTPLSEFELTVHVYELPFENRSTKILMGIAANPYGDRITVTLSPQPRRSSPASHRSPVKTKAASPAASSQVSIPGINCKNSNPPTVSISPIIRKLLNEINGLVISMPSCSANRSVQDNPRLILSAVTEDNKLGQDDDKIPSDLANRCTSPESPATPPASLSSAAPPPPPSKAPPSASLRSTSPSNKDVLRFGNRKRSNEVFSLEEADFEEQTEKNLHKKLKSASSFSSPTTVQAPFSYIVRLSKEYYMENKKKSSVTITPIPVSQEIVDSTKEGVHSPNGPEAAAALQPRLTK